MPVRVTVRPLMSTEDPASLFRVSTSSHAPSHTFQISFQDAGRDLVPLIGYRLASHQAPFTDSPNNRLPSFCRKALIHVESTVSAAGQPPESEVFVIDIPEPAQP